MRLMTLACMIVPAIVDAAAAQSPVGTHLRASVDTYAIVLVQRRDSTPAGHVIDRVAFDTVYGVVTLSRVYRSVSPTLGNRLDSLVDDAESLRPMTVRSTSAMGHERIDVDSSRARGNAWLASGEAVTIDVAMPAGTIGGASVDLAIRSSDLRLGAEFRFDALMPTVARVQRVTARVTAIERVGGVDCWRVEARFVGMPVVFWVDQRDRSLQRQVLHIGPAVELVFLRGPVPGRRPTGRSS